VTDVRTPVLYRAAGTVRAARRVELATRVMGRIESVLVRAGDPVHRGQVLLTVERASLTASQGQARSAVELAEKSLRRTERLYADSAATLVQLEAARNAYAQAEAQSGAVAADLAYTDVQAPFDGVITSRTADPGDLAGPGQTLLTLEDRNAREIVVTVPEELGERLRVGPEVAVRVGAGARSVTARVTAVVAGADPRSPTLEVRLVGPSSLAPGLAAVAELPAGERNALLVPESALIERGQLEGVYLFAPDSTFRLRWIRTGLPDGSAVEVVSGLKPGDIIALDPSKVHDGLVALPLLEGRED
jgi:RND family efflux transporter MFP subunit